ncbi:MAG: impB/mucB/samB family protein [Proteobacteria bacterium]|nr:impB/mucB/samB family protein [Pseudomonadota bacterium]
MSIATLAAAEQAAQQLRWLYVDFNSYFASVEQQLRPELRGKPVAVVPVASDATCAIAASYEAKAFGIKTGTPIYEARQMCPGLICVLAQHEHYVSTHHRILEEVERHIPVSKVCSIDEVACYLMDNENTPHAASRIAASIKRGLRENIGEYVRCSIGVAPNRLLAKIATDLQKPDGFTVIEKAALPGPLLKLKLTDIPGIGRNMELRLRKAGVGNMQQLWALDAPAMRRIWGSLWGEKMWYMLRGIELPDEETQRSSVGHSHVLSPELREPGKAQLVARRLMLKAASRLRRLGYFAGAVSIGIRLENGPRLEGGLRLQPVSDTPALLHALDALWHEAMAQSGRARIKKVSIVLHELSAQVQQDLLEPLTQEMLQERARADRLSQALDTINHRFGRDSVLVGLLPAQGRGFSGTKVAFTRIPDEEEFLE